MLAGNKSFLEEDNMEQKMRVLIADPDAEFGATGGSFLDFSSSSTDGSGKRSYSVNNGSEWDKTIHDNDTDSNYDYKKLMEGYNSTRKLAVYVDGKLVDTFTVEVDINGN